MPEDADILTGLYGLRVAGPDWIDLATALAVGILVAALLLKLSGGARVLRPSSLRLERSSYSDLPDRDRTTALANLLREMTEAAAPGQAHWTERAAERFGLERASLLDLRKALYDPNESFDPRRLEDMLDQACRIARI